MIATNFEQLKKDLAIILTIEKYLDETLPGLEKEGIIVPKQNRESYYLKTCWVISKFNAMKFSSNFTTNHREIYDYLVRNFHLLQEYKR